jgi:hypothetical protein
MINEPTMINNWQPFERPRLLGPLSR